MPVCAGGAARIRATARNETDLHGAAVMDVAADAVARIKLEEREGWG